MNPVLYLIMRNDIPSMNPGKLAAQAAHVANAFEYEFGKHKKAQKEMGGLYKAWKNQTKQGFGTTIVLGTDYIVVHPNYHYGCFSGLVFDPTYPCPVSYEVAENLISQLSTPEKIVDQFVLNTENQTATYLRNQEVGAYVFGDKENWKVRDHVMGLELYP